mmetsp:Transcript_3641/g.7722  ORF Transcript_3641/g.7722 Transcript_3641/m.7722 type:complete len:235 (+) Transcript_3641:327-1031(+)
MLDSVYVLPTGGVNDHSQTTKVGSYLARDRTESMHVCLDFGDAQRLSLTAFKLGPHQDGGSTPSSTSASKRRPFSAMSCLSCFSSASALSMSRSRAAACSAERNLFASARGSAFSANGFLPANCDGGLNSSFSMKTESKTDRPAKPTTTRAESTYAVSAIALPASMRTAVRVVYGDESATRLVGWRSGWRSGWSSIDSRVGEARARRASEITTAPPPLCRRCRRPAAFGVGNGT